MKLGTIGLIPYEKPGSEALFKAFKESARVAWELRDMCVEKIKS